MSVNLWVNEEHALSYLRERETLPHRVDALEVLCELLPARVERVADLDEPLPESLGTFDVVLSSFAIHHCVPARQRELYAEVFEILRPGGLFVNAEHVASPTAALHEEFLAALGRRPYEDDPSNQLVAVEHHLSWLNAIGFVDCDCFWKWRELAVVAGTRPPQA
jgi:tRNA (cmo5U34)-methyltransferase